MCANFQPNSHAPLEGYIPVKNAALYYRETGRGEPLVVLYGGPDFNHDYFLPELDRLADSCRLIYYDQRGRGKSAGDVKPEDVSIESEIEDLEELRAYFHLVLMNTAPASHDDFLLLRQDRREKAPADIEKLKEMRSLDRYKEGDLETDAGYYRIHFRTTLRRPEHLERVVKRLRSNFTKDGVVKAREIEDRLVAETWSMSEYDLFPSLERLRIPALVIHGEYDLVPHELAAHVAQAIPRARFVLLEDAGHFSFLERPDEVQKEIVDFLNSP
jgi:proline iminopeptidase